MICAHCGHGALRIHVTAGQAEFLKDSCGKNQPIPNHVDRPRLRRLALGRIPANQDCPHTNQCASALRGECYRAAFQGEEYSCPVARGRQYEANNPPSPGAALTSLSAESHQNPRNYQLPAGAGSCRAAEAD